MTHESTGDTDARIIEAARLYQAAERAAIRGNGSLEDEYARRRALYLLLDAKYGPPETQHGR